MVNKSRLEFTVKALIIGLIFTVVFCGTNVYLGLKIGSTISASIPAAVLAMGLLRMFKKYSVLENSISQTTASAGESMAIPVIFVFPALLILGTWENFNYLQMLLVMLPGAITGVVYSIILRKVLLSDRQLGFPEGQAIGKVLLTTEKTESTANEKGGGKVLMLGMLISSITSFCQIGLQVLSGGITKATMIANRLFGGGVSFSVAVMSAGFLVGFAPMCAGFIALVFAWCILLPIFAGIHGITNPSDLTGSAFHLWSVYIRPVGIGVFIFAGFATIVTMIKPIIRGVMESVKALKDIANTKNHDKDLNFIRLFALVIVVCIPVVLLLVNQLNQLNEWSVSTNSIIAILITLVLLVFGFGIAAVSGYFAGLAGSTLSPVSGLLFIAVMFVTLIIQFVSNHAIPNIKIHMLETIILLVGFIAASAAITNCSIQDFKSGNIVGSTPYKQQFGLFTGVILAVIVAPVFITLIFNAYGIAGIVPHAGMNPNNTLSAPQASAVAALTGNILGGSQDWSLIFYGMLIGALVMALDTVGRKTGKFRFSMVSVGMGIYLPPDLVFSLFIGGCVRLIVDRRQNRIAMKNGAEAKEKLHSKVNLLVCGLIAGESLMGLILAVPFVIYQSSDALKIVSGKFANTSIILSVIVSLLVLRFIYKIGTKFKQG